MAGVRMRVELAGLCEMLETVSCSVPGFSAGDEFSLLARAFTIVHWYKVGDFFQVVEGPGG